MSAGGVTYLVIGLLAIAFFYVMYGVLVEEMVTGLNEQYESSSMHTSQDRMDAAYTVTLIWHVLPILALIGLFMFGVVIALRESDGNISEGW